MLELVGTVEQIRAVETIITGNPTSICMHDGEDPIGGFVGNTEPSKAFSRVYEVVLDKAVLKSLVSLLRAETAKIRIFYDHRVGNGEVTFTNADRKKLCEFVPALGDALKPLSVYTIDNVTPYNPAVALAPEREN